MIEYLVITNDEFELPIHACDTVREVAKIMQMFPEDVKQAIKENRVVRGRYRIIAVELGEDDEDEIQSTEIQTMVEGA